MADMVSPLDGVAQPGRHGRFVDEQDAPGVVLSHRICSSLCQVNAWTDTDKSVATKIAAITKLKPGTRFASPGDDNHTIMPIGPGRYLISSAKPDLEERLRKSIKPDLGAVISLAHGRVVMRVEGKKAEWVLSKGIAVDFSLKAFPIETSIAAQHHEIGLTIRRVDEFTFDLLVFTSFARAFWHWLEKAAGEVGYEII